MKIRTGFVSNSSSTSYVVFLPKDFDLEDYMAEFTNEQLEQMGKWADCSFEELIERSLAEFQRALDARDSSTYQYGDDYGIFEFFEKLFEQLIISAVEQGGDGEGVMKFVRQEDLENKIKYKADPEKKKKREAKKEELKKKYKDVDPYGEEKWEEENIIKRFKDL